MGVKSNDDIVIPYNSACVCICVSGCDPCADAEGENELEIFTDLVSGRCRAACVCDLSTDDSFLHTAAGRVFRDKCGVLYRGLLPDSDRALSDVHCVRADRADPQACTVAGNS